MDEGAIWDLLNGAYDRMTRSQKNVWEAIGITPEQWVNAGYQGAAVWVVAVVGRKVIWYNPFENGFDVSRYETHGTMAVTSGNQLELQEAVQHIANEIVTGQETVPRMSGPIPGEYDPGT